MFQRKLIITMGNIESHSSTNTSSTNISSTSKGSATIRCGNSQVQIKNGNILVAADDINSVVINGN
jgi:viroplasmin and RNaseH domain-containing protein